MATLEVIFKDVPPIFMSPYLNLNTPRRFGGEERQHI